MNLPYFHLTTYYAIEILSFLLITSSNHADAIWGGPNKLAYNSNINPSYWSITILRKLRKGKPGTLIEMLSILDFK